MPVDSEDTTPGQTEVWLHRSADPHTAQPDWLLTANYLTNEARILALVIIARQKGALQPTRDDLAQALGVEVRSIGRWLNELTSAGVLSINRLARRNIYTIHRRKQDHMIPDHAIPDHVILLRTHAANNSLARPDELEGHYFPDPIRDLSVVGGGGDHHDLVRDSTTTTSQAKKPRKAQLCETRLGRFMAANGYSVAAEFDSPELDADLYIAFILAKQAEQIPKPQIVHFLRLGAPRDWQPPVIAEPSQDEPNEPSQALAAVGMTPEAAMQRFASKHGSKR